MKVLFYFIFTSLLANSLEGANILFYFACSGYSHRISVWPIIEKLSANGHSVTFLSPYPAKTKDPLPPNVTDYVPDNLAKELGVVDLDFIGIRLREGVHGADNLWNHYYKMSITMCAALMKKASFLEWVNKSSFDLIIFNANYNECGYGLAHKWNSKIILFSPTSQLMWFKDAYGLPDENLPEVQFHYPFDMTFFQSVKNELLSLFWLYRRHSEIFPQNRELIRQGLGLTDIPPLDEIEKKTSLVFTYTQPSEDYPRSLPPNFVEIGGIHLTDKRKHLPADLTEFISTADNGFALLSFGTYLAVSNLPQYLQDMIFGALSKIEDVKFLVKFNGEPPKNLPSHIKTVQWIPQQDIMAHPKMRALIAHGGLLGTQEAVTFGIPMIVLPFKITKP